MEHLIPTLLGIAGALLPALGFWMQQRVARDEHEDRLHVATARARRVVDELLVRGGRVYL